MCNILLTEAEENRLIQEYKLVRSKENFFITEWIIIIMTQAFIFKEIFMYFVVFCWTKWRFWLVTLFSLPLQLTFKSEESDVIHIDYNRFVEKIENSFSAKLLEKVSPKKFDQ